MDVHALLIVFLLISSILVAAAFKICLKNMFVPRYSLDIVAHLPRGLFSISLIFYYRSLALSISEIQIETFFTKKLAFFLLFLLSVSYTHLDVYKRQEWTAAGS